MDATGFADFPSNDPFAASTPSSSSAGPLRSTSRSMPSDTQVFDTDVQTAGAANASTPAAASDGLEFQNFDDLDGGDEGGITGAGGDHQNDMHHQRRPMLEEDDFDPTVEYPLYRINYYRKFFNVETVEVVSRIQRSLFPIKGDFLDSIHTNPDLYGPFWVVTTLVFLISVCGNVSGKISSYMSAAELNTASEFEKISVATSVLYTYHTLGPLLVWGYTRWRMETVDLSLLELVCLVGYANTIYIPVAMVCTIPSLVVGWISVSLGFVVSTSVIIRSLWPVTRRYNVKTAALPIFISVFVAQLALAILFKLYFFNYELLLESDP